MVHRSETPPFWGGVSFTPAILWLARATMPVMAEEENLTPFQRAVREAAERDAAAAGHPVPSASPKAPSPGAVPGRAIFGGENQADTRSPFLASEAAQHLKVQQVRMENARREAEKQRLKLDVERHKSHIFLKKQELARVSTRLRSAESALVAAEADERRALAGLGASAGSIHEKTNARERLAIDRANAERDFERREIAEGKAVDSIDREMDKLAQRMGPMASNSGQHRDLERKKKDRERGLASIRLERSRRRTEAMAKDAALSRQLAGAERAEAMAHRAAELAQSLVSKYRLQVRAFSVARDALVGDLERMGNELSRAEAALRLVSTPMKSL